MISILPGSAVFSFDLYEKVKIEIDHFSKQKMFGNDHSTLCNCKVI